MWSKWNNGKKRRIKNILSIEQPINDYNENSLTIKDTLEDHSRNSNISFVTNLLLEKINKVEDEVTKNILSDVISGKIKNKAQIKKKYNLKEKELSEIYQKLRK